MSEFYTIYHYDIMRFGLPMRCLSTLNRPMNKRKITHSKLARGHKDRLRPQYSTVCVGRASLTPRLGGIYRARIAFDIGESFFTKNERSDKVTRLRHFSHRAESKCECYSTLADGGDNSRHGRYWAQKPNSPTGGADGRDSSFYR